MLIAHRAHNDRGHYGDEIRDIFGIHGMILFTTIDADLKPQLPRLEALDRSSGVSD